jgi:PAS domain S-box-containing protein
MRLADQIRAMGHGDHVCLIYDTLAEQVAALAPFIRAGLERGERCVYVCDDNTDAQIAEALGGAGVEVERELGRGGLRLLTRHDAHMAGGEFSPQAMIDLLRGMETEALADGFTGLRLSGEMTWALGPEAGCDRVAEYEALLNRFFAGSRALAICQYNRERFSAEVIEQALQTHPVAVVGDRVISNLYYEPPEVFLDRGATAARVDWKIDQLRRAYDAEERIRDSEERYRLLVQGVPDAAMFWLDPDGRVTNWNEAAERITGHAAAEVVGRDGSLLAPEGDGADRPFAAALRQAADSGHHSAEGWRARRDGSLFWACEAITATRDPAGRLLGFTTVLRDVTERRRADALLAAQKRSLELVVAGAPLADVLRHLACTVQEQAGGRVAASILLLDGESRLRNGASPSLPGDYLHAIDGLPADPCLGTCCMAAALGQPVVTPDFAAAPGWRGLSHLPLALGYRGAWSMPILARDGQVLGTFGTYFRECREPTAEEREVVEILSRTASIAIEGRRAEEELLLARDAAEEASHAKSQFLAVMSHELRTPLTGIIGYADLLGSDIWGPTTDQQRMQIARIKAAAWHLVSIIEEILTFSRVEAGKEGVAREPVDLERCIRESVELLQPQAAAKGIALRVVDGAGGAEIETDVGKLRQIVLNLAGNAVKFTDRGFVELSVHPAEDDVVVAVRDTGPGIPAEQVGRIFEPFVQVDPSHTRLKGGTGLGLTVCRSLAQLLGGDVRVVESAVGSGTTFALRLPRHPAREAAAASVQ